MERLRLSPPIGLLVVFAFAACDTEAEPEAEAVAVPAAEPVAAEPAVDADAGAVLTTATAGDLGPFIADQNGRALYMFTADSQGAGQSACYDACAEAWPPYLAPEGTPTAGAPAVQAQLIGTLQRRDGSTQVTYGGWPLYYFQRDTGAGQATGQDVHGFGGEWYLVTPAGERLEGGGGQESTS